jgi:hypothetical protein
LTIAGDFLARAVNFSTRNKDSDCKDGSATTSTASLMNKHPEGQQALLADNRHHEEELDDNNVQPEHMMTQDGTVNTTNSDIDCDNAGDSSVAS